MATKEDDRSAAKPITADALLSAAARFFDHCATQSKKREIYPILKLAEHEPRWREEWLARMRTPILESIGAEKNPATQRIALRRETMTLANVMIAQEDYLKRPKVERAAITESLQPAMSQGKHVELAYETHLCATLGCAFLRGVSRGTFRDGKDNDWYAAYAYLVRRHQRLFNGDIVAQALGRDHDQTNETAVVARKMRQLQTDVLAGFNFVFNKRAVEGEIRSALTRREG